MRLHRVRTEDRAAMRPMFNDLRAHRFPYNDCDFEPPRLTHRGPHPIPANKSPTLKQGDWESIATRLPDEAENMLVAASRSED
jgi:hypothetical protein